MNNTKDTTPVTLRDLKPVKDVDFLIKTLATHATFISARRGQRFNYLSNGQAMCYLIEEGDVTIHRAADGRVISSAYGPAILGTGNYIVAQDATYITANQPMRLGVLPLDVLATQLEEGNLWRPFSHLLLFTISHFLHQNLKQVTPTSYERIRTQILTLNSEPEEIKSKTNLARYIQDRTLLSRSHIMMIISTLKKGGHIEVNRGVLVSVEYLPKKF